MIFRTITFLSPTYLKTKRALRKVLNESTLFSFSTHEIASIGQYYDKTNFENYKRHVVNLWYAKHSDNSEPFIADLVKVINHLNIELSDNEFEKIETLRNKLLTKVRSLKELDYPYIMPGELNPNAKFLFNFTAVSFSHEGKVGWLKKIAKGDLFIFRDFFFVSSNGGRTTSDIYYFANMSEVVEYPYAIKITFDDGHKPLFISIKFNEIIFIAIKRIITKFHKKKKILLINKELFDDQELK